MTRIKDIFHFYNWPQGVETTQKYDYSLYHSHDFSVNSHLISITFYKQYFLVIRQSIA